MLEELLAVVGGHDDERAAVQAAGLQVVQDAADLVVGVADLAVVEGQQVLEVRGRDRGRGPASRSPATVR